MDNKQKNITEKCMVAPRNKDRISGTESLVKQGRGTDTLITTAARNGGDEMVEWAGRGGESM
ncbi:MAG: hypothetical protein ACUZ8A_04100 [Candidatus Bathyanammoxibius sp.]